LGLRGRLLLLVLELRSAGCERVIRAVASWLSEKRLLLLLLLLEILLLPHPFLLLELLLLHGHLLPHVFLLLLLLLLLSHHLGMEGLRESVNTFRMETYIVRGVLRLHLLLTVSKVGQWPPTGRHLRHLLGLLSKQILLLILIIRLPDYQLRPPPHPHRFKLSSNNAFVFDDSRSRFRFASSSSDSRIALAKSSSSFVR